MESKYVHDLYHIKKQIAELRHQESLLKHKIHECMTERHTNVLTTDEFVCKRSVQQTQRMVRDNVPEEIWERYSTVSEFPKLNISRLK